MADLLESISSKASIIAELAKRLGHPELMLEISDLKIQLAELRIAYAELQNENLELKSQRQEDIDNPLSFAQSGIFFDTHQNRYCSGCYKGQISRRIPLVYKSATSGYVIYSCPICKTEYKDKSDIGPVQHRPKNGYWSPI